MDSASIVQAEGRNDDSDDKRVARTMCILVYIILKETIQRFGNERILQDIERVILQADRRRCDIEVNVDFNSYFEETFIGLLRRNHDDFEHLICSLRCNFQCQNRNRHLAMLLKEAQPIKNIERMM